MGRGKYPKRPPQDPSAWEGRDGGSHRRLDTALRRREALAMRQRGKSYQEIADALGYSSRSAASTDINKMIKELPQENAHHLRKIEVERMDQLLDAMWDKAMKGDGWAVDRCLKIMERRAKLLGLDAPIVTKVEMVTEDVIDKQIRELERQQQLLGLPVSQQGAAQNQPMVIESARADRPAGGD